MLGRFRFAALLALTMSLILVISGCSVSDINKSAAGSGMLVVSMDLATAKALLKDSSDITVNITVTKGGQKQSQDAPVTNGRATASFPNLAVGTWTVEAKIMDGGYIAYEGSGTALISEYQATELNIPMTVVLSDLVVTVSKPPAMAVTKGSITLTDPSGVYPQQRRDMSGSLSAEFGQIKPILWQIKVDVTTADGKAISSSGQILLKPGRRNAAEVSLSTGSGSLGINLSYEAQSRYSVSGYVYDITRPATPLSDVMVTIGSASAKADANGWFALSSISPGEYEVTIDKAGYQRYTTWLRDGARGRDITDETPSTIKIDSDGNMLTVYAIPLDESQANYGTIHLKASATINGQAAYNTYAGVVIVDTSSGQKIGSYDLPMAGSQWSGGTTTLNFDGRLPVKAGSYTLKINMPAAVTSSWGIPAVNHLYSSTITGIAVTGGQTKELASVALTDTALPPDIQGTLRFSSISTPSEYIYLDIYKSGEMTAGTQPVRRLAGTGSQVFRDMKLPAGNYDIVAYTFDSGNNTFGGLSNRAASYSLIVKDSTVTTAPVAWKVLPKLRMMYPLDGAARVPAVPTVSWERIAGAKSYLVSVGSWTVITQDPFVTYGKSPLDSGLTFPAPPLKPGGSYGISVVAMSLDPADAATRVLSGSPDYYLSILGYIDSKFNVVN